MVIKSWVEWKYSTTFKKKEIKKIHITCLLDNNYQIRINKKDDQIY